MEMIERLAGNNQVRGVDRIKGAAEDRDFHLVGQAPGLRRPLRPPVQTGCIPISPALPGSSCSASNKPTRAVEPVAGRLPRAGGLPTKLQTPGVAHTTG